MVTMAGIRRLSLMVYLGRVTICWLEFGERMNLTSHQSRLQRKSLQLNPEWANKKQAGTFFMCVTTCWLGGALPVLYSGDYNEFGQSANSALVLGLA